MLFGDYREWRYNLFLNTQYKVIEEGVGWVRISNGFGFDEVIYLLGW